MKHPPITSETNMNQSEKEAMELALREREIALKEKELELRERELQLREVKEDTTIVDRMQKEVQSLNLPRTIAKIKPDQSFFSLRPDENPKIFSYEGRLSRKGYLFFNIVYLLVCCLVLAVQDPIIKLSMADPSFSVLVWVHLAICVAASFPGIFADIKRCRDCNISPWFTILFCLIPLTAIYILFKKSVFEGNKYI